MKRYEPGTSRPLVVLAALAMTALTVATLVVAPAHMDGSDRTLALAAADRSNLPTAQATEVAIEPARIDVVEVRGPATTLDRFRTFMDRMKQAG